MFEFKYEVALELSDRNKKKMLIKEKTFYL